MTLLSDRQYRFFLTVIYICVWLISAINPHYFADWLLENVIVIAFMIMMALTWTPLCLSKTTNTLIFLFLSMHSLGAHYTYSLVPYDDWARSFLGVSLNELVGWDRNNYDRVVHFSFGLLLAFPLREVLVRFSNFSGGWSYIVPFLLIISMSTAFEIVEWVAAIIFGGDLGQAYLGTQGDEWDSHKDTLWASLGGLIAVCLTLLCNIAGVNNRRRAFQIETSLKIP
ncbi:MAG: DUF2238 domain-containing protein [Hyphomicrobiales bacterium]